MLIAKYPTKKVLKGKVGESLRYLETSMFGEEYTPDGSFCVVGPGLYERKWYATVTMEGGKIKSVK